VPVAAFGLTDVGRKRRHNEDAYLMDAERGLYYTLNEVGGRVWELLAAGEPMIEVLRVLGDEYKVDEEILEADVAALLREMRTATLIERVGS
jgi:hypothetical protein